MQRIRCACFFAGAILIAGCGRAYESPSARDSAGAVPTYEQLADATESMVAFEAKSPAAAKAGDPAQAATDKGSAPPPAADRKIIYEASLRLVVEAFASVETQIPLLAKQHQGYVASANVDSTQGDRRSGSWTVRIPVEQYDSFLDAVAALGVPESRTQKAQDVSAEFVDLQARLSNKKKLEERILQLLTDRSGEIKDIIAVETELGRVREEIERMEGQLRFLSNRISLTTVTITAREERDYKPPTAPTFAAKINSAWTNSLDALQEFGANLAIALVYIAPWLVLLLILGVLVAMAMWLFTRVMRRVLRRA